MMWGWLFPAKKALLYSIIIVWHSGQITVEQRNVTEDECRDSSWVQVSMVDIGMGRIGNEFCIAQDIDAIPMYMENRR